MCEEVVLARGGGERLNDQIDRLDDGDVIAARQIAPEGRAADLLAGDRLVGDGDVRHARRLVGAGDAGVRGGGVAVVCFAQHIGEFAFCDGGVEIYIVRDDTKLDGPIDVGIAGGPGRLGAEGENGKGQDEGKRESGGVLDSLHFRRPPFLIFG